MGKRAVGATGALSGVGTLIYTSTVKEAVTAAIVSVVAAAAAFAVAWLRSRTAS